MEPNVTEDLDVASHEHLIDYVVVGAEDFMPRWLDYQDYYK